MSWSCSVCLCGLCARSVEFLEILHRAQSSEQCPQTTVHTPASGGRRGRRAARGAGFEIELSHGLNLCEFCERRVGDKSRISGLNNDQRQRTSRELGVSRAAACWSRTVNAEPEPQKSQDTSRVQTTCTTRAGAPHCTDQESERHESGRSRRGDYGAVPGPVRSV